MRLFPLFFVLLLVQQSLSIVCIDYTDIYDKVNKWIPMQDVMDSKLVDSKVHTCAVIFEFYKCIIHLHSLTIYTFEDEDCHSNAENVACRCGSSKCAIKELMHKALALDSPLKGSCNESYASISEIPDYEQHKAKPVECLDGSYEQFSNGTWANTGDIITVKQDLLSCGVWFQGSNVGMFGANHFRNHNMKECHSDEDGGGEYTECYCPSSMCNKNVKNMLEKAKKAGLKGDWNVDELHALLNPPTTTIPTTTTTTEIRTTTMIKTSSVGTSSVDGNQSETLGTNDDHRAMIPTLLLVAFCVYLVMLKEIYRR